MPARWPRKAPTSSTSARNSTRPYGGAKPVSADDEMARLQAGACPRSSQLGRAGLDRHHQGVESPPGRSTRARRSSTTSGACSAIPDMAPLVAERGVPVIVMHNREQADAAIDIVADVHRLLRTLAGDRRAGRHRARQDRARSRHRLRQDAGAEHHCIARLAEFKRFGLPLLVGASRKRFINTVDALARRTSASAARSPPPARGRATAPRSCACMTLRETVQALRVAAAIESAHR